MGSNDHIMQGRTKSFINAFSSHLKSVNLTFFFGIVGDTLK